MPINFDLELIRKEFDCKNYMESGLYDPRNDVSCRYALKCNFDKLYSIEIRNDFVELAKIEFSNDILTNRLVVINDDSTNMHKYLNISIFNNKTLFFLDAHVDNEIIKNYKLRCPLIEELYAISNLSRKDNIICIDDIRYLKEPHP